MGPGGAARAEAIPHRQFNVKTEPRLYTYFLFLVLAYVSRHHSLDAWMRKILC